jgi:hypothetical protein
MSSAAPTTDFSRLTCSLTPGETPTGHLCPLFWQHGEDPAILRAELRAMRSVGILQCILESRPHPDWLGPRWWADLDVIMDEARSLGMKIWVFDDGAYPSGRAGTLMRDRHPLLTKVYLARRIIEAHGPTPGAALRIGAWRETGESVVAVVAGRRPDPYRDSLDPGSLVDLTDRVQDGLVTWDVPEGWWRVHVMVRTSAGGEEGTRWHLNPLVKEAGEAFIAEVYEAHKAHYSGLFGSTFAGFFTDEPRFGNKPVYEALIGRTEMVVPWSDDLLAALDARWQGSFRTVLPLLWHDGGETAHRARAQYMDEVSGRFGRFFSQAIGDWCRANGLRFIGHVVEDNSAHARLGHGAGHLFRALSGQDMGGLDLVYQVWPDMPEGRIQTPFGPWDLDFFRWAIAKLASSAAHADPKKAGAVMCEIFGAYGWQLGLRDMKWLTDFAAVRGVNFLVPHAFSPLYPDPDCPPHFHARGQNPQWRLFGHWSSYAERVCHLLSGGEHEAPAAVLYHAEAEWAGDCERVEGPVRALAERQLDCDIVCIDTLLDPAFTRAAGGKLVVNRETFACLVVPWAQRLPLRFLRFLPSLLRAGVPVIFSRALPIAASDGELLPADLAALSGTAGQSVGQPAARVAAQGGIAGAVADAIAAEGAPFLSAAPAQPRLRTYHYRRRGMDLVFCTNEDPRAPVATTLTLRDNRAPFGYDPLTDTRKALPFTRSDAAVTVDLVLAPYASLFVVLADVADPAAGAAPPAAAPGRTRTLAAPWRVSTSEAAAYPRTTPAPAVTGPGDVSLVPGLATFAGTIAYESEIDLVPGDAVLDLGRVGESSEAWLDGKPLGTRICPPHWYALPPAPGKHALRIEVTTTLARRHGDNVFDRALAQEPTGLLGPIRVLGS